MGADAYAAIGAGFSRLSELFAQRLGMSMEEKRALAHEEAMQKRQIAAEDRAERRAIAAEDRQFTRQTQTPVERRAFQSGAEQGPPLLMIDKLNQFGESIGQVPATQREKEDFATNARNAAEKEALEGREFKDGFWIDKKKGTATPEQGYLDQQVRERAAGRTEVNIAPNQKNENAFQDARGKADSALYDTHRNQAITSQQAMNSIDALDSIFSGTKTGKLNEVYGQAAQWAGLPEGADYQATEGIVQERVFELLNALKGPATDKDAERVEKMIPSMGTDPRARKVIFDYMRKKAQTNVQLFDEMDKYAEENNSLKGFKPSVGKFAVDTSPLGKSGEKPTDGKYAVGKVVDFGGKRYRVIPGGTPEDPNLEEI